MECPSCRAEVRDGSRFCDECGASAPLRCLSCGSENRPGARFCSECGLKLNRPDLPAPVPAFAKGTTSAPTSSAERRQLTILFCDLVGSTEVSARLDPEDMREVFAAYHKCVVEMVARFDGFIAKYMGDGVLAYFGWPQAHEDEAERAVRAGLAIVDALAELETPAREPLGPGSVSRPALLWLAS